MSKAGYDDIQSAWEDEIQNTSLQSLSDRRLSRIVASLSKARLELAGMGTGNKLQAELLTQEILNMEFMLRDLLEIRRKKILELILQGGTVSANMMTVSEGEFYNRVKRAFDGHEEYLKGSVAGTAPKTEYDETVSDEERAEDEYIIGRFLRAVEEPIVGLDEMVHGPFERDSVATIPRDNAMNWLEDGTIARVIID
ncbi:hypothetical protein EU546_00225 [Candidatus Thorarchaeota archaeon]|nr:MAG: hypothetical protein EU546_00225 [Candidatus Thorarchaeota archaeon]